MSADRTKIKSEIAKYLKMPEFAAGKSEESIKALIPRTGKPLSGKTVYNKYCQGCHIMHGKGVDFGPGLSEIGDKFGKEGLYRAIVMPDAGISFGYEGVIVKSKNGDKGAGIVVSDTETDLDLKMMGGVVKTFKKHELTERTLMEKSMMPNLSASMSDAELVDLVEYLTTLKKSN